jgi:light-independent protochlorophyllide reductase subunit B
VTDRFQQVAQRIEQLMPNLVCGTQMERHSCRKLDLPCMVIAPPTHIENHLLSYKPILGFDGADVLADEVYTTATLGMEKHLIDLFGDAGLEYEGNVGQERGDGETAPAQGDLQGGAAVHSDQPQLPSPISHPPTWASEAQAMLKKVPFFVRGRVQKKIEQYATDQGIGTITADVVQTAKETLGG